MIMGLSMPLLAVVIAISFCAWLAKSYLQPKHRYPPGPKGLPLIGSLLDINNERPWITYGEWAKQYGDIVMYWVMGKPVILLGKMQHADALLQKRMVNYADRPQLVMAQELVTQNGWYIGTARIENGTHKKQRKILNEHLRASALKTWAHPAGLPEARLFLQRLSEHPERFAEITKCFTVNVMLNTTFAHGSIPSLDNPLIKKINEAAHHQFLSQVQGRFWVDYVPFLRHLPTWLPGMSWKRQGLAWRDEVDTLYGELWDRTKEQASEEGNDKASLVRSLQENQMHQISELEGPTIASAMVDAGTETLTGTTIVLMMIFMYFPEAMRKGQEEVDKAIGRDRLPNFDDISRVPYITAMIREAFRWRTVAPVAIPHACVKEDTYAGYFIPKGATVFALSHHIHQDEELYPEPEKYMPERFLDEKGQLNNLPHAGFGFGTRKCLGQHFAEQTLFLLISSFLWSFDIKPPIDQHRKPVLPSLDPMDWGAFLASPPPTDFQAVITPRSQTAVGIINQAVEKGI